MSVHNKLLTLEFKNKEEKELFANEIEDILQKYEASEIRENEESLKIYSNITEKLAIKYKESIFKSYGMEVMSYLIANGNTLDVTKISLLNATNRYVSSTVYYDIIIQNDNMENTEDDLDLSVKLFDFFRGMSSSYKITEIMDYYKDDLDYEIKLNVCEFKIENRNIGLNKTIEDEKREDISKKLVSKLNEGLKGKGLEISRFSVGKTIPKNTAHTKKKYCQFSFPEIIIVMDKEGKGYEMYDSMVIRIEKKFNELSFLHEKEINFDVEKKYIENIIANELKRILIKDMFN